ncbi:V-type ATP synthase beta chain [Anaeromyxobacter paludicola]|uniref:V-type ATP synthase beta chain n=1 Tax=Anaeromyxobacter paludicola TaxID=2918171 RepID=A0ABM7X8Q2_9BACT|nr:V-type ATP synthase beta chain [Anaeromyxobacter paludicola]
MDLVTRRLRSASGIAGPLLFLEEARRARLGELVRIRFPQGERRGQVIELDRGRAVIQVLEETRGIAPASSEVELAGEVASLGVGQDLLGRAFDGAGRPVDGLPPPVPEARVGIQGSAINVVRRAKPEEFIETGLSTIDGLETLVRGQKLPIFSGAGLPAARLASQIARQARVHGGEPFSVVFAAIGAPHRDCAAYLESFTESGALDRTVLFLNRADDPPIERLMTPRCALTAAEHLAFVHGMHVLVVLTDMTSYCEALREVALAREEIPGRRGYPGYMYTDLATLYERAGRVAGKPGSVTQLPVLTMPDDDITHPIPDLTGYITEGQLVLSRDLDRAGVYPPIDPLPSLARLMNAGIGKGRTREDHRGLADQLYAAYARGRDVRRMAAIVGRGNLGQDEKRHLEFADRFEREFLNQGDTFRTIEETLDLGWRMLDGFPDDALTRVKRELVERYRRRLEGGSHGADRDDAHGAHGGAGAALDRPPGREAAARQA